MLQVGVESQPGGDGRGAASARVMPVHGLSPAVITCHAAQQSRTVAVAVLRDSGRISSAQTGFVPISLFWSAIVVVVFPAVFGYAWPAPRGA